MKTGWRRAVYVVQITVLVGLVASVGWQRPDRDERTIGGTSVDQPGSGSGTETVATTPSLEFDESTVSILDESTVSIIVDDPVVSPTSVQGSVEGSTPIVAPTASPSTTGASPAVRLRRTVAYSQRFRAGWTDLGWSKSRVVNRGPAKIDMGERMGWVVARVGQPLDAVTVEFRYRTPKPLGAFLQVTLASSTVEQTSEVAVANLEPDADGWYLASLPIAQMNPKGIPYDRIRIRPTRFVPSPLIVEFDDLVFLENRTKTTTTVAAADAAPSAAAESAGAISINCGDVRNKISPLIYGIGYSGAGNLKETPWTMGATVNRWGGNPTSRYNWQVPNAWNTAADYYFRNVQINDSPDAAESFLANNERYGLRSAVSLPMIGWVAKDATSYSFPVSKYGEQQGTDPSNNDIGNGLATDGQPIESGSPKATSVQSTPATVAQWVGRLKGRVSMYFLDNEPELWDSTHRDVHPEPLTYDELLDRTVKYATAVRAADPDAVIAGPASWGWPAYFWSAADAKAGFDRAPDRRAHGNMPLIPWYLQQVRAAEKKSGVKLLDVLDVHFYPAAEQVFVTNGGATDEATSALRIRQVRGLWDPTYKDESWVREPIYLIPRLREWVKEYAPGLGISIGEWNFGAETHMSGGLATAEALGRFGVEGVYSAYYWTNPPVNSPSYWAFRAFRNYDGNGAAFNDRVLGATGAENLSLFASINESKTEITAMVLNTDPKNPKRPRIALNGCGATSTAEAFLYAGGASGFASQGAKRLSGRSVNVALPPYSIAVVRIPLGK